ncbi:EC1118_1J11_2245p [Saccharomyces cerevisiae EC1118]|uniref:Putative uncharacterized protein YJL032W n=2 Tax=Saccharomyces cerevisiae TaxID=4932 RepID=YJD2_YEAST|nr:RecName: Full=Putative uncharacterized protein YJL032W [Saccharomyces cerevisiae S288C]AAS56673.1 YJL032W [Saccharomyces cerevisiae]WNV73372.1 hypothetical protein O6U65_1274 [Saccharomyces cerevisiae synthetic construct]CAA89322.1 unnamed protein product [Saccharomyces cerevisiae]CAY80747.2 EC1118_1J11_2245p [Saccharomyces cerevisiae EC1118]
MFIYVYHHLCCSRRCRYLFFLNGSASINWTKYCSELLSVRASFSSRISSRTNKIFKHQIFCFPENSISSLFINRMFSLKSFNILRYSCSSRVLQTMSFLMNHLI